MAKALRIVAAVAAVASVIATAGGSLGILGAVGGGSLFGISATAFTLISTAAAIGASLLMPKGAKRRASEASLSLGEVPRQAIVGRAATAGSLVDAFNYGGKYGTDWEVLVIALADHRCDALEGFYVNDVYVPYAGDGMVAGYNSQLQIFWRPGTETQTVPSILTANGPGWTVNDNGAGVAYAVVAYKADAADAKNPVWPGGRPKFLFVVRGALCYDPRKDSSVGGSGAHRRNNPATWEWSENLIVCRYQFVLGFHACDRVTQPDQLMVGRGLSATEAPPQNLFARANLCDEMVDGEPRYRVGGVIGANETFIDVESDFAAACAGTIVQPEGAVEIDPGEAKAAVVTITDRDLVVGSKVKRRWFLGIADRDWVNTVLANYTEPAHKWQPHVAPVRRDVADVIADGAPREETLNLGMVSWAKQAGRVAEIFRRLGRLWIRAEIVLPPRFCDLEEGDWIIWQSDRYLKGQAYTFRVEAWGSDRSWQHSLTLRQISASCYSDTAPLSSGSVAVNQPARAPIGQPDPSNWALAAGHMSAGGLRNPALIVTGASNDPSAAFVRMEYCQGAAAPTGATIWSDLGVTGPDIKRREIPVAAGGIYRVALSYVVDGVQGDRLILGPVTAGAVTYPDGTAVETLQPAEPGANLGAKTAQYPTPPPTNWAEGSVYIDASGKKYRFDGRGLTFGGDPVTFGGDPILTSGYADAQDQLTVTAAATADAAQARVDVIASDNWLSAAEKPTLKVVHEALVRNHVALDAKAASLGVAATERSNASAAINALNAYLSALSPPWSDMVSDTPWSGAAARTLFDAAHDKVAILQAAVQGLPGPTGATGATGPTGPAGTNGIDGIDGLDGKLVEFVWKRAATIPATPTGNGIPSGWSDDPPSGSDPLWMSKAKQELDGTLVSGESWSTPIRHDGPAGADGADGATGNRFVPIYRRAATLPATPTGDLTPSGWSQTRPAANGEPMWESRAEISGSVTLVGSWSTPVQVEAISPTGVRFDVARSGSFTVSLANSEAITVDAVSTINAGTGGSSTFTLQLRVRPVGGSYANFGTADSDTLPSGDGGALTVNATYTNSSGGPQRYEIEAQLTKTGAGSHAEDAGRSWLRA